MISIDALGPGGPYRTRNREAITTVAGEPIAELSLVPPLYVSRAISAQRRTRPLPVAQRRAALARAAEAFTDAVIAGLDFPAYVELASRVSGLPIRVARAAALRVGEAVGTAWDAVRPAQPVGSALN
ncbi:MAG: aldehyde dehydrogenase, partial [Mycobacterium sp.]